MFWCLRIIIFMLLILYNFIVVGQYKLLNTIVTYNCVYKFCNLSDVRKLHTFGIRHFYLMISL